MTDDAAQASPDGPAVPDRSSPAADVHARDWARTRTSDATTPPPPPAVAVVEASSVAPSAARRPSGAPRRAPLVVQGLLVALAAGVLAAAAGGQASLVAAVVVLQVVLVLAVLALLGAPAARGAAVVAAGAALAADVVVVLDDGAVDRLAGVVGLSLVVALLHQLVRAGRSRVTESLADTLLAVLVATAAACLLVLPSADGGRPVLRVALAAAAAVVLAGRFADRLLPRPVLTAGATRGWPGLLLGAVVGVVVSVVVADLTAAGLSPLAAGLLGLAVVVTVAAADLALDLGAAELRPDERDARRAVALTPAAALLPLALLGPVALLAGRLVLS